jgi:hypothetical protein
MDFRINQSSREDRKNFHQNWARGALFRDGQAVSGYPRASIMTVMDDKRKSGMWFCHNDVGYHAVKWTKGGAIGG